MSASSSQKALAPIHDSPMIAFGAFERAEQFAERVVASGLAPKGMTTPQAVIAMQLGHELGLPPLQSIQNIAVINGRPTIWGDMLLAIAQRSPEFDHTRFREVTECDPDNPKDADSYRAICEVARVGDPQTHVVIFSVFDAKRAKLWDKEIWQKYPKRMLQMRARSYALRDRFAGELKGLVAREEFIDIEPTGLPAVIDQQPESAPQPGQRARDLAARARQSLPPLPAATTPVVTPEPAAEGVEAAQQQPAGAEPPHDPAQEDSSVSSAQEGAGAGGELIPGATGGKKGRSAVHQ